jgi:hypothetical protein
LSDSRASDEVRRLVIEVVDSFEKLEILVHVMRAGNALAAADDIAVAVGMKADEVERCIKTLRTAGVFDPSGAWASAVATLIAMYEADRIAVLELMTRTALERVRKQAARVFADAFVLKPRKKGDTDG